MFCYFVRSLRRQTPSNRQKGVQILEPQHCEEHEDAVNEEALRDMFSNMRCHVFREQSQAILTAMRAVYWPAGQGGHSHRLTAQFSG